jgi:hypothetical protein
MHISNISDLARRSDYRVDSAEAGNPVLGTKARVCTVYVRNHDRRQSVWSLIALAADAVHPGGLKSLSSKFRFPFWSAAIRSLPPQDRGRGAYKMQIPAQGFDYHIVITSSALTSG